MKRGKAVRAFETRKQTNRDAKRNGESVRESPVEEEATVGVRVCGSRLRTSNFEGGKK